MSIASVADFNINYDVSPPEHQFASIGDGAYWDFRLFLVFLYRDQVYSVLLGGRDLSEAERLQMSIDIAEAVIPRL